jgi:GTPase SAR1 family protein
MLNALAVTNADPLDIARTMAEAYLRCIAPPLDAQTLDQLYGTHRFAEWLGDAAQAAEALRSEGIEVPEPESVRSRIALAGLLQPLRALADKHFVGRKSELRRLADHVGVLPSGSFTESVSRGVRSVLGLTERPPLVIHGPGGVGKSTLVARFVLDHVDTHDGRHLPFAYLSFDRVDLLPQQPLTLLSEAARQLGLLFPDVADQAQALQHAIRITLVSHTATLAEHRPSSGRLSQRSKDEHGLTVRFAALSRSASAHVDLPLLLVLDAMEQAQRQGEQTVSRLWEFIAELASVLPRLRVVIAGRAPLPDRRTRELHLEGLGEELAAEFLQDQLPAGFGDDESFLHSVIRKVGANPLSLKLAAELIRREGQQGLDAVETRRQILFRLTAEEVQGVLYRRILDHLDDPDLRRIASPGLTLRRITPEVIRSVLAAPCGLGPVRDERAHALFDALAAEASLVESVSGQTAVVHRSDVRRTMLPLLDHDDPVTVRRIHKRAVRYYAAQSSIEAKAEELYHRLALGQSTSVLDQHWNAEAGMRLESASAELPPSSRVYLSDRLGLTVDTSTRASADDEVWARQATRSARALLDSGRPAEALSVLHERGSEAARLAIAALEIEANAALGRLDAAMDLVGTTLNLAGSTGSSSPFVEVALLGARIAEEDGNFAQAQEWLRQARLAANAAGVPLEQLLVSVAQLRVHRRSGMGESPDAERLRWEVVNQSERLGKRERRTHPSLVRDLAAEIGALRPQLVSEAAKLVGLDVDGPAQEVLNTTLTPADVADFATVLGDGPAVSPWGLTVDGTLGVLGTYTTAEQGQKVSSYLESLPTQGASWTGALVDVYRSEVDTPTYSAEKQ